MKFRKSIGAFASLSLLMTAFGSAFAEPELENFNPVVQHEIITQDENSDHALRAVARFEVPEGVTVRSEDFMWVINAREDIFNPLTGITVDDTSKDETDTIGDESENKAETNENSDEIIFDNTNESDAVTEDNAQTDESVVSDAVEGASHTAKLRANPGTVITGHSEVVLGLVLILDIPLNEDAFDIKLQFADSDAVNSSIK